MDKIDKYINSLCKHMDNNSEEVMELKVDMRGNLLKIIEELMLEGKGEDESIKIAMDRFGDINEIETELLEASNIKRGRSKGILYLAAIFAFISVILLSYEVIRCDMVKLPIVILFLPVYIVLKYRQLDNYRSKGINVNKFYEWMKICFTLYITVLISNAIFPLLTYPDFNYLSYFEINLIPLQTIVDLVNNSGASLIHLMMYWIKNIILFVPLGFLYPIVFRKDMNVFKAINLGIIVFISISLLQILLHRMGISAKGIYISFDYMILNILGILIGTVIFIKSKKNIYTKYNIQ